MRSLIVAVTALSLLLPGCSTFAAKAEPVAANGPVMVAAANPLAVEAGLNVLRRGGSAVDAAVTVQAVLGLVEPQSSGLGGGAFLVHYDAETKAVTTYDGRETAPAGADAKMFLGPDGRPMSFIQAVLSGRSTGVPGAVAMLQYAQKEHGRLPWNSLFGDAERLATDGFKVSPRMAGFITSIYPQSKTPDATAYFTRPDGKRYGVGDTLKNPAYAESLRLIAVGGADGLLKGPLGEAIVARVAAEPMPGSLTARDLAGYRPLKKKALCSTYRVYQVCTAPPASSGVVLLQALKILEQTDIASRAPTDPVAWLQIAQAERLMYADRDRYVGDEDFVSVPVKGLLSDGYVAERAKQITDRFGPPPTAGIPPGAKARGPDRTLEPGGTSHIVIVDARGDVVSMTTTVESIYGSGRMVGGFFLNNQLTDFNFAPNDADGAPAANAVAPGKRPRSSMSPVIILDKQGRFVAAVGSPGGSAILSYNLKTLVGVLDWNLTMQQAIDLPNLIARGGNVSGEAERFAPGVVAGMAERGLKIQAIGGEDSGVQGIIVREGGRLEGGADPRREGVARGF
ncbi:gamma-glutamyltransferase [Caulobacter sp. NIBR1757]|uniref:gamma-glutamyltransferase n=1 Tax=Caulobacter sp. NIBR1757 TaxID=3016000 RepID=UPI0022F0139E|nr:gamma-glutamyltransferase [Caulobacter sp. NIBR1757]WGM37513.1 Glutathione hydrolase proenzyme [Caulobacter sp. NIBR1757]